MGIAWGIAGVSLVIWIVLLVGRGGFWLPRPRLDSTALASASQEQSHSVVAIIPARDEEIVIQETLPSILNQDLRGAFHVILVDDRSEDATAAIAHRTADQAGLSHRLTVVNGLPLPSGWAGKVWAMNQGSQLEIARAADYIWFTDADIAHDPGILQALVQKATTEDLDLVSLMAQLRIDSRWDRLLIPAFVYFFAKLYPFRFVNNNRRRIAGAAGGCILVRRTTLDEAGGVEAIRAALIDDCALGRSIKRKGGRVWLGFTHSVRSVRAYGTLRSVWDMVARSAFHQLNYSVTLLSATLVGMLFIYAVPPVATLAGLLAATTGSPGGIVLAVLGGVSWGLMGSSFVPILRHQHSGLGYALLLPVAGILYAAMTLSSAWRHITGRSGMWKGRPYSGT
ncbi:glycosyltransferase [Candidatus Bipolaricaulota bacterium]|nr:glycosyltransferase [Candidatus Bipolaricaulota bacterium]